MTLINKGVKILALSFVCASTIQTAFPAKKFFKELGNSIAHTFAEVKTAIKDAVQTEEGREKEKIEGLRKTANLQFFMHVKNNGEVSVAETYLKKIGQYTTKKQEKVSIKVDIEARFFGKTALHQAVENSNFKMVVFLIDNKANINVVTDEGKTPLDIAEKMVIEENCCCLQSCWAPFSCCSANLNIYSVLVKKGAIKSAYGAKVKGKEKPKKTFQNLKKENKDEKGMIEGIANDINETVESATKPFSLLT